MSQSLLARGWHGRPWVFLRLLRRGDPRAAGFGEISPEGFIAQPYEVVHAPGFGMWATPAMQARLAKLLTGRSLLDQVFRNAPGRGGNPPRDFARYEDSLPPALRKALRKQRRAPITEDSYGTSLVLLSPDNKKLGGSSFGPFFNYTITEARRSQSAATRLATLVGLIATALEEPGRVWWRGEELPRVVPAQEEISPTHTAAETQLRQTILRLAMLKALPAVLRSMPDDASPAEVCGRLADWVATELLPDEAATDTRATHGDKQIFTRDLLSWPDPVRRLLFDAVGEDTSHGGLRLLRAIATAKLTPDQFAALFMDMWGIEPLDRNEYNRLKTHRSRARAKLRRLGNGGDL